MISSILIRQNRVHVETALIFITPAVLCATGERHLRRFLWQKKIDSVKPAHITMIFLGFALIQKQMIERTSLTTNINAINGKVGRISHAKRRFEGLDNR